MKLQNKTQDCKGRRLASPTIIINNQAFTLVELIVVITILAILGTIAFISLQGYSAQARDSKRLSDIQNIKKSVELFSLNTGKYPEPDDKLVVSYSGETLWYQGTVGEQVTRNLGKNLNEKPIDPLTESEYTYSITSSQTEYEVLSIYESDLISLSSPLLKGTEGDIFSNTNAGTQDYPKIDGNYNGIYVKTSSFYLPTPSIINAEILSNVDLWNTTLLKSQIITGGDNLPGVSSGGLEIELSVYEGLITDNSTYEEKLNLIEVFQMVYSGTILANDTMYADMLSKRTIKDKINYIDLIILGNIENPNLITTWQDEDSNCQISADVKITGTDLSGNSITQVWSPCNSTLGEGIEYSVDEKCYDYEGVITSGCNLASNTLESSYNSLGVENIWGKLYLWTEASKTDGTGPCPSGRSLPSQEDWTILLKNLGCNDYVNVESSGLWQCDGLGWGENASYNPDRKMIENLNFPLAGLYRTNGSSFDARGYNTHLWSSNEYDSTNARGIHLYRRNSTVNRDSRDKELGFSVRCIKD